VVAFAIAVLIAIVLAPAGNLTINGRDLSWISGSAENPRDQANVYSEYLRRHRKHRFVGGVLGSIFALVVGVRYYARVSIGVGQQTPLADLFYCGMAGVILGALSAESYRLSQPQLPWSVASLATSERLADNKIWVSRVLAVLSLFGGLSLGVAGRGWGAFWVGAVGLVVVIAAELTLRAIDGRKRTVLSDQAHVVDNRLRLFATNSVCWLQLAAALLTLSWTISKSVPDKSWMTAVQHLAVWLTLLASVVCTRRGAPRPPRRWSGEVA
jgi:hypothetical protein